jgi:Fur family ferric uptake transcriptional regulator
MSKKSHLKRARLKITQPRLKILNILKTNSVHHLGADDIYQIFIEENQKIGLATVYLVLAQFELAGLVIRHRFEGGPAVYKLNDTAHH